LKIRKVGVIGCGLMGSGIAQVVAQAGYSVLVSEVSMPLLQKGLASIEASLERLVKKEKITIVEKEAILARIQGTTDISSFGECDLVVEAAAEDLNLKKQLFMELDRTCPPEALLATNTSCLPVREIAGVTGRPQQVAGLHFFNPAPAMKLVEIIQTEVVAPEVIAALKEFSQVLGKTPVIVRDSPGFIVNRLMVAQIHNAIRMVEAGIATKENIDTAMTLGLNHPLGPLALADLIGLDTLLAIANGIHAQIPGEQYAAPETLKKLVAEGKLGRKTGQGFYHYA
jgi:3-hydroxybutyryl-CoA dehydrogenase